MEKMAAIQPPTKAATMPRTSVSQMGRCCLPGMMRRPSAPMINPTMIALKIPVISTGTSLVGALTRPFRSLEDTEGHRNTPALYEPFVGFLRPGSFLHVHKHVRCAIACPIFRIWSVFWGMGPLFLLTSRDRPCSPTTATGTV